MGLAMMEPVRESRMAKAKMIISLGFILLLCGGIMENRK
jgi:hypothetical protein